MRLHLLPHDAIENVFSHLSTTEILATASASPFLTLALATYLQRSPLVLDQITKQHLLACPPNVANHIRHLSISGKLLPNDLIRLSHVFTSLHHVSFNLNNALPSSVYYAFLVAIAPSLTHCSAEVCAGLTGDVVLNALAAHCENLQILILRFTPHVHAHDIEPFVITVGHSLRVLKLEDCAGVDDQVLIAVARYCHNLESLCVGGSEEVGDDGVIALAESPCASTLTALDIRSCMQVTDVGAFALATSCFALRSLNLWRVCVTSYGVRAVAEGLGVDLETLVIGDCIGVDDTALKSIADNCDSLLTLEMCGLKRITDDGIMSLFDSNRNGRLKLHNLTIDRCTNITSKGVLAATGLWDGTWATCCSCTSSFCNDVSTQQTDAVEPYSLDKQPNTTKRKRSSYHDDKRVYRVAADTDLETNSDTGFVEHRSSKGPCGPQLCRRDCWNFREADTSQRKCYVSYLRKLSAVDTRVGSSTWKRIREYRHDLHLVADDCGLVTGELIERDCVGDCLGGDCAGNYGDESLVGGMKRHLSDPTIG